MSSFQKTSLLIADLFLILVMLYNVNLWQARSQGGAMGAMNPHNSKCYTNDFQLIKLLVCKPKK